MKAIPAVEAGAAVIRKRCLYQRLEYLNEPTVGDMAVMGFSR